jgi:hypothetical protein
VLCLIGTALYFASSPPKAGAAPYSPAKYGALDCNGKSPAQHPVKVTLLCTDIRGIPNVSNANNWNDRFYDNGEYIGHDEPDATFNSSVPGSGNNVTWNETIGTDPSAAPTVKTPGSDVTHWFELTPAPWTSMALCDGESYPLLPCTPESDKNAPSCIKAFDCPQNSYAGAGSAVMELQLYPPGEPPFVDSSGCNDTTWCAALTIDSLECSYDYVSCNPDCEEPVNFGFIQKNGLPTGPPSPQAADLETFTPNKETLQLNSGDKISIHEWDAPVPGVKGAKAFKTTITDLTTHQSGSMQASAANGFTETSPIDCSGTPFNWQPEYNTAARDNINPWAALSTNISTEYETGHFEACTSLKDPYTLENYGLSDQTWLTCKGPYEDAKNGDGTGAPEPSDALCFTKGDTHYMLNSQPDEVTGCQDDLFQNGDLDFDGSPYYADWPQSTTPTSTFPGAFSEALPTTAGGKAYASFYFQTDVALSELNTKCGTADPKGCVVPPSGPGKFYPYWSEVNTNGTCTLEFGNVAGSRTINAFGKDAEYGSDQLGSLGYPEFEGRVLNNTCPATKGT